MHHAPCLAAGVYPAVLPAAAGGAPPSEEQHHLPRCTRPLLQQPSPSRRSSRHQWRCRHGEQRAQHLRKRSQPSCSRGGAATPHRCSHRRSSSSSSKQTVAGIEQPGRVRPAAARGSGAGRHQQRPQQQQGRGHQRGAWSPSRGWGSSRSWGSSSRGGGFYIIPGVGPAGSAAASGGAPAWLPAAAGGGLWVGCCTAWRGILHQSVRHPVCCVLGNSACCREHKSVVDAGVH
jgi:hypothetical protein